MRQVRVIPVLLIHDGDLVKTTKFKKPAYVGDPINAVRIFNEKEIDEIVVLDIDATREGRGPDFEKIAGIASEAFIPLAYGGGITTLDEVSALFYLGVEKVVFNNAAYKTPNLLRKAADMVGSQSIVASIDIKKNLLGQSRVCINNGQKLTGENPVDYAKKMEENGAGEIFLNSIDRDGTYEGYDLTLIERVSRAVSIPVIACGGASSIGDFISAVQHGASAVAAGSMFVFQRPHQAVLISYPTQPELNTQFYQQISK